MIEGMAEAGFFRWLCLYVAELVHYKVVPILIAFMLLSGLLSMFIDSITVMLFLATVTIELGRMLKFNPVPMIISQIFAANTGGSATMCGDPPNIIIGTALGFTFTDFVQNTGPIALAGMLVAIIYYYFSSRKQLSAGVEDENDKDEVTVYPQPRAAIKNMRLFVLNTAVFILVIILLVTHAQTGISVASVGVIAALLVILIYLNKSPHILSRLDWRTLLFFIGLFICVGALEETGVLNLIAEYIGDLSGGNLGTVIAIILWFSAFASAIVDNIPFAATMVPIISQLSVTHGLSLPTMSWTLALGTDIGGNATPIGASANVVGTAIAEREGYHISWGTYLKLAFPATIIVLVICHLLLVLRYA